MARQRDHKAEYARRVRGTERGSLERQRARGHAVPPGESEYRRRVAGTAPGSEERARAAGRRGYRALLRAIGEGDTVGIDPGLSKRNAQGQWTRLAIFVHDERTGEERIYFLTKKQMKDEQLIRDLIQTIHDRGAIDSPLYPLGKLEPEAEEELEEAA